MLHLTIHKQEVSINGKKVERLFTRYNCKMCGKPSIFSVDYPTKVCSTCGEPQPAIGLLVNGKLHRYKVAELILNYYKHGKFLCSG